MSQEKPNKDHATFFAFGRYHKFLTPEEAKKATPDERIRSIWPLITRKVLLAQKNMTTRELAAYDPEDLVMEVYVALRERDSLWVPEDGEYKSFAAPIIDHALADIRDVARTVHSPASSATRVKQYEDLERRGALSKRKRRTLRAIRATISITKMGDDMRGFPDKASKGPCDDSSEREWKSLVDRAIEIGMAPLDVIEQAVVIYGQGLNGQEPLNDRAIARMLNMTVKAVRARKAAALSKLVMTLAGTPELDALGLGGLGGLLGVS